MNSATANQSGPVRVKSTPSSWSSIEPPSAAAVTPTVSVPEPGPPDEPGRHRDVRDRADEPDARADDHQVVGAPERRAADLEAVVTGHPDHVTGRGQAEEQHRQPATQPDDEDPHRQPGDDDDPHQLEELRAVRRRAARPPGVYGDI